MGEAVIDRDNNYCLSSRFIIKSYTGMATREIWGTVRGFVMRAIAFSRGELDIDCIWRACEKGHIQIWVITEDGFPVCVMLTELRVYAEKKSCNLVAVAGKQARTVWKEFFSYFKTWLIANNVDEIQATCRPSVARLIRTLGFTETACVMTIQCKEPSS